MMLTGRQKSVIRCAVILGIIQGLIYEILSLIFIILHYKNPEPSYDLSMISVIYLVYIHQNSYFWDTTASPDILVIAAWLYLFLYISLIILSIGLLTQIKTPNRKLQTSLRYMSTTVFVISLIDFVIVCMMGSDYNRICQSSYVWNTAEICGRGMIPMLVITAKLFLIWFINVYLAYELLNISKSLQALLCVDDIYYANQPAPAVYQIHQSPAPAPYPDYQAPAPAPYPDYRAPAQYRHSQLPAPAPYWNAQPAAPAPYRNVQSPASAAEPRYELRRDFQLEMGVNPVTRQREFSYQVNYSLRPSS